MDWQTLSMFLGGFVLLVVGAEVLVRGASRLAVAVGITPLVVGQTVVAYGTSAPELAVSLRSTLGGQPDIAIGNVVGSNISNILLVLGFASILRPLKVSRSLVRSAVPLMIGLSLLVAAMGWDGRISQFEGGLLSLGAVLYSVFSIVRSRQRYHEVLKESEFVEEKKLSMSGAFSQLAMIVAGIACLVLGATWLVNGAVYTARLLGVSELIIGLTVIAVGTSLPEIATSVMAGVRGAPDIAMGNAVGSNIFNILLVLGACALFSPAGVPVSQAAMRFDIPVMIAVALVCLPIFFTNYQISRYEGLLLLGYYVAYLLYLVLQATEHDALGPYSTVVLSYLAPLTALILVTLAVRSAFRRDAA